MTFKTEEEAIRKANGTVYGLAAAVLTNDVAKRDRMAKAFRAGIISNKLPYLVGIVWVNCSQPCFVQAPWGGLKQSGLGRELGTWGLKNYLEVKQVTSYEITKPGEWGWYIKQTQSKL